MSLMALWKTKASLSQGHPFKCSNDFRDMTLDVIWDVTFGKKIGTVTMQLQQLSATLTLELSSDIATEAVFAEPLHPEAFDALMYLEGTIGVSRVFSSVLQPHLTLCRASLFRLVVSSTIGSSDRPERTSARTGSSVG